MSSIQNECWQAFLSSTLFVFCSEIERERDRLSETLELDAGELQLAYTVARGYHLSLPLARLQSLDPRLRRMFIQQQIKGRRVFCTTEVFISLDSRQSEAYAEIALMAGRVIEEILDRIRQRQRSAKWSAMLFSLCSLLTTDLFSHLLSFFWLLDMEWLAQVAESLAFLDLTLTFADVVSRSTMPWGQLAKQHCKDSANIVCHIDSALLTALVQ